MLNACGTLTPDEVVNPEEVTVSDALKDIGVGFAAMGEELGSQVLGLYPCEVKVTFNVKTSAKEAGKLVIDLSTKPRSLEGVAAPADPAAKAGVEKSGEATAERGNTVDIRLYNPGCLPKGTLGYEKPAEVLQARDGMAFPRGMTNVPVNVMNDLCTPLCTRQTK